MTLTAILEAVSVILSRAKSLPRAMRGDLCDRTRGILRFAQNDNPVGACLALVISLAACERPDDGTMKFVDRSAPTPVSPADEPPVAINPVSPVRYPPTLLEQGIEGQVLLRLYVDAEGRVIPDSTRIEESSGYPALDSAALVGSPELQFSPALHQGRAIAAPFIQPIQFRGSRVRPQAPTP
jgi:TonB family protein